LVSAKGCATGLAVLFGLTCRIYVAATVRGKQVNLTS